MNYIVRIKSFLILNSMFCSIVFADNLKKTYLTIANNLNEIFNVSSIASGSLNNIAEVFIQPVKISADFVTTSNSSSLLSGNSSTSLNTSANSPNNLINSGTNAFKTSGDGAYAFTHASETSLTSSPVSGKTIVESSNILLNSFPTSLMNSANAFKTFGEGANIFLPVLEFFLSSNNVMQTSLNIGIDLDINNGLLNLEVKRIFYLLVL